MDISQMMQLILTMTKDIEIIFIARVIIELVLQGCKQ